MKRSLLKACTAWIAAASLMQPIVASAATPSVVVSQPTTAASGFSGDVATYYRDPASDPALTQAQIVNLLRHRVKYVFVIFQENRSFDHYFGTFPGANGLFSDRGPTPAIASRPSNTQPIYTVDAAGNLTLSSISPFRIGDLQQASSIDDVDHGHPRMATKMDIASATSAPAMDRFALAEEDKYANFGFPRGALNQFTSITSPSSSASTANKLKGLGYGQLAMAYVDCDTIPFLWNYANRFTLFDNIFQTTVGPSTPNAIAMIAGQSGETQWVKHSGEANAFSAAGNAESSTGVPVVNDPLPGAGIGSATTTSNTAVPPTNISAVSNDNSTNPIRKNEFGGSSNVAPNLTFATVMLTLAGRTLSSVMAQDPNASVTQADIQSDIPAITNAGNAPYAWRWYQNGYNATEPGLPTANGIASTPHASYIGHHNGPQYFGYVTSNPTESADLKGLGDFFNDISAKALPSSGGVFYVRGGYDNTLGLKPDTSHASTAAANVANSTTGATTSNAPSDVDYVLQNFNGDDDHPAYSDGQISEALVASEVNAIAASPYWNQSAIVITYDESEGDYDHVAPRILSFDPGGLPLSRGPRIPLIVISPYSRVHVVSSEEGDHNSVIGLVENVFGLTALGDLPDESSARTAGQASAFATAGVTQLNLGPHDGVTNPTPGNGRLLSAFDPARLQGTAPALPASYAMIPASTVTTLPHYAGNGCSALGITPIDTQLGVTTTVPSGFTARPGLPANLANLPTTTP